MTIAQYVSTGILVVVLYPGMAHSALYMAGGLWVGENLAVANTTMTADEEVGKVDWIGAHAELTEDGTKVKEDTKNCDVDSAFVTCTASAKKRPPTANCEYCGTGEGKAVKGNTTVWDSEWGINPTYCGSNSGPGGGM